MKCGKFTYGLCGGYRDGNGKKVTNKAHRRAWELAFGAIPPADGHHGMCVLHRCDNTLCVNPSHLMLGSQHANMLDMLKKQREQRGERHAHAVLDDAKVRDIRRRAAAGERHHTIGLDFGICTPHVWKVVNRRIWTHVK